MGTAGRRDRGFSLIELVIMIALTGFITTSLVGGIIVLLRNNVAVSTRNADNADLLALATWLPQDVNSTPTGIVAGTGVELGNLASGCATADVGTGLLRLTWTEQQTTGSADVYRVSYRAVTSNGTASVSRVSCKNYGTAVSNIASEKLALNTDGSFPFAVTSTVNSNGQKVVMAVTQHPGTSTQKVVQIEATSKNPGVATLPAPPPAAPPPTMTLSTGSVAAGSGLSATFSLFKSLENITVYLDYTYSTAVSAGSIGTGTANSSGAVSGVALAIPLSATNGTHQVFAVGDSGSFVAGTVSVVNGTVTFTNGVNTVVPGGTISVDVNGFDTNDLVTLLLDSNTVLGTLTIKNNSKTQVLTIPLTTAGGQHVISANGATGRAAISGPFSVVSSLAMLPTTIAETLSTSAVVYGYRAAEGISYYLDSSSGTLLTTTVADINGYNKSTLVIPAFTSAGSHNIVAVGDGGTTTTTPLTVTSSVRAYTITAVTPSITAGSNATLTLQATINGANDPTVNGAWLIAVTGPTSSPNLTAPTAAPTSVTLVNGVGTISVNLVNATPTKITVTETAFPNRTGQSTAITVSAGSAKSLNFAVTCPALIGNNWNSGVTVVDLYGNAVSGATVTMTFSPVISSSVSIRSLSSSGWTTVTSNSKYSAVTNSSGSTPSFTATGPTGNTHKPSVLVTATTGVFSTSCTVGS